MIGVQITSFLNKILFFFLFLLLFIYSVVLNFCCFLLKTFKGRRQNGALLLLGRRDSVFDSRLPYFKGIIAKWLCEVLLILFTEVRILLMPILRYVLRSVFSLTFFGKSNLIVILIYKNINILRIIPNIE